MTKPITIQPLNKIYRITTALKNLPFLTLTPSKFRNSRKIIGYFDEKGKVAKQQRNETEYIFFDNNTTKRFADYDGSIVTPDFLVSRFRNAFEHIGRKTGGFTLATDSTAKFGTGGFYDDKTNADVSREIVWKRKYWYKPQSVAKDTVITPGWTYYINVEERQGR